MASIKVKLLTGRSLDQGRSKNLGKFTEEYKEWVARCELDPEDMENLQVSEGESVRVTLEGRRVVLRAAKSRQGPHRGIIFIPYGLWANFLISDVRTQGTGMPTMKNLDVEVEPATGEEVLGLDAMLNEMMGTE